MTQNIEWRATVRFARPAEPLVDEQLATLTGTVPGFGTVADDGERLTLAMTVTAATLRQASEQAMRAARDAWAAAVGGRVEPLALQIVTAEDHERELLQPAGLDLVGLAEVGELLGVSHQRAGQLADTHPDFPAPVGEPRQGRVFTRQSVERFRQGWRRQPGRPRKVIDA